MSIPEDQTDPRPVDRRNFFQSLFVWGSISISYGLLLLYALKFLYPGRKLRGKSKMFVAFASDIPKGGSLIFSTPKGERYLLTRSKEEESTYRAFSSRCPHLGCKVLWREQENRFFCPCHAGAFDETGKATEGPPAKAGQSLKSCEIKVVGRTIYALVEAG